MSRLGPAGQTLTEYRHYALHGSLLIMALAAVLVAVGGRVGGVASGSGELAPVAETTAVYMKPPVLVSTVPSIVVKHQAEVEATSTDSASSTPGPEPTPTATREAAAEPEAEPEPEPLPLYFTYIIQEGDTVSSVAAQFGIDPDYILWNNRHVSDPDVLLVGAHLLVPSVPGIVYHVSLGDTLSGITSYYGISIDDVLGFPGNGLVSADGVIEGMVLLLPGAAPPALPPAVVVSAPDPTPAPNPEPTEPPAAPITPEPAPEPLPVAPAGGYIWPVYGPISTYFSWGHQGIDIDGFNNYGAPILSAKAGTVVLTAWDSWGYGYHVIVDHGDGSRTLYAHLSDIWVAQGQAVAQGEAVGSLGSTGYSTGPHLHFELWIGGVPVDPLAYLP